MRDMSKPLALVLIACLAVAARAQDAATIRTGPFVSSCRSAPVPAWMLRRG